VQLLKVRLAMALGGNAFCTMTGDVAPVQASVAAARQVLADEGVLMNAFVRAGRTRMFTGKSSEPPPQ
jgi:hypothetical protein